MGTCPRAAGGVLFACGAFQNLLTPPPPRPSLPVEHRPTREGSGVRELPPAPPFTLGVIFLGGGVIFSVREDWDSLRAKGRVRGSTGALPRLPAAPLPLVPSLALSPTLCGGFGPYPAFHIPRPIGSGTEGGIEHREKCVQVRAVHGSHEARQQGARPGHPRVSAHTPNSYHHCKRGDRGGQGWGGAKKHFF